MEVRKLIKFGNSSHVISIPNVWLKKNNLNKGDVIYFEENGNNELVLTPQIKEKKEETKEVIIDTTNKTLHSVKREIVSAYVNNNRVIKIIGKDINEISSELREFIHNLLAVEIIEETQNKLIARDFLNVKTLSTMNIIRRMDIVIRSMLLDAKDVLKKEKIYDNIMNRDHDLNRLTILAFRSSRYYMENQNNKENFSIVDYFKMWSVAESLEKIGDEIKRFARYLKKSTLSKNKLQDIIDLYTKIGKVYIDTMSSLYKEDKTLLFNQAAKRDVIMKEIEDFLDNHYKTPCVPHILEKLKNLLNHTHSIIKVTTYN
ncbi:phosphate uptake regulator PhoU [Candidatus Woesearchaeota archaeon]|nr:phosphate uptake regulator PhoU [Candidatus Woesearchaeota archaeon]